MKKIKERDKKKVIDYLTLPHRGRCVTAEEIVEELDISYKNVHRIFASLRGEGWGITPRNSTPYWRQDGPNINRGRGKGDKYHHDRAEPDWCRTRFEVSEPGK